MLLTLYQSKVMIVRTETGSFLSPYDKWTGRTASCRLAKSSLFSGIVTELVFRCAPTEDLMHKWIVVNTAFQTEIYFLSINLFTYPLLQLRVLISWDLLVSLSAIVYLSICMWFFPILTIIGLRLFSELVLFSSFSSLPPCFQ